MISVLMEKGKIMKIFVRTKLPIEYTREKDMKRIIEYLNLLGTLFVDNTVVEVLYLEYCKEVWNKYWMTSHEYIIIDFARWLENYDYPGGN